MFYTTIRECNFHMQNKISLYRMKLQHLDLLFEREVHNMKVYCYAQFEVDPELKLLCLKLQDITVNKKTALLKEYFNMCKLIFNIRTCVAFALD